MFNSLRVHQYINDFFNLIEKYYKYEFHVIRTSYYLFDNLFSTYDSEILRYGAYERIGDLSGYRWIKIYNFPVAFSQQALPRSTPNEYGVTKPTETTATFPKINFVPTMLDFVTFWLQNEEVECVYQVSAIDFSYIGNKVPIYKVTLKSQFFNLDEVNNQVFREYSYCEISDKIYEIPDYNNMLQGTSLLQTLITDILSYKEPSSGLLKLEI